MNPSYESIKIVLDILFSAVAIVLLCPLWLLIALLVKIDSKGPVIHKRKVVDKGGREFNAYKFRTMVENVYDLLANNRNLWERFYRNFKLENDCRIIRVGRFLRATSLDEVPQLLNVLIVQISLIVPCMSAVEGLYKYDKFDKKRIQVKPGIIGHWQVSGQSDLLIKIISSSVN